MTEEKREYYLKNLNEIFGFKFREIKFKDALYYICKVKTIGVRIEVRETNFDSELWNEDKLIAQGREIDLGHFETECKLLKEKIDDITGI